MTSRPRDNAIRGMVWGFIYLACVASIVLTALWFFFILTDEPAAAVEYNPAFVVDGMDGTVTISDTQGNSMIVEAKCARVIYDNAVDLPSIHHGLTATPEYMEACS